MGIASPSTQTTDAERKCLAKHAIDRMVLAEIGVWHGVTTSVLRKVMNKAGTLFAIDPYYNGSFGFSPQKRIAQHTVSTTKNGQVCWLQTTGVEASKDSNVSNRKFDFVFIDGDHSFEGLKGDWECWSELVVEGGVIALHDSRSTPIRNIDDAGSVQFTNKVARNDSRFKLIDEVDSLTVFLRAA